MPKRGQAHTRRIKTAIHRNHLTIDKTGAVAAQKAHRIGHFFQRAVAALGNRVVVICANGGGVNLAYPVGTLARYL